MNFKRIVGAAALAAVLPFFAPAAQAAAVVDPSSTLVADAVELFNIGDIETVEINGNAADGGGMFSFGLLAGTNLLAVETNSLNPATGFAGAQVTITTGQGNTGTNLGSISGLDLLMGNALVVGMNAGQTYWLNAIWSDVTRDSSNFDLRIEAVPVPASLLLIGAGLLGLGALRRKENA